MVAFARAIVCGNATRSARKPRPGRVIKSSNSETQNSLTWTVELRGRVRLVVVDQGVRVRVEA